jgi:hypothetical protein
LLTGMATNRVTVGCDVIAVDWLSDCWALIQVGVVQSLVVVDCSLWNLAVKEVARNTSDQEEHSLKECEMNGTCTVYCGGKEKG